MSTAVAYALDVRDGPGPGATEKLVEHLNKKRALILLDNCEHLVGECSRLALRLLQAVRA